MTSSSLLLPAALLLFQSPISVRAYWGSSCYTDNFGSQQCSTNNAARYGTAIGIAVLFALLFYLCLRQRRRRAHSANLVYAQQQQAELGRRPNQQGSYSYGGGYAGGQGGGQQATAAGYPSQSYGQGQTGMYNASADNYTGVQAPPPMYSGDNPHANSFAPPPGPPPNFTSNNSNAQHDSTLTSEQRELQQHEENLRRENGQEPAYSPYASPPGGSK